MKFGLFGSAQAQRGGADLDSGQGFRDFIEYNVEAEALGYDSSFVVEHHFTGFGQVSASSTGLCQGSTITAVPSRKVEVRAATQVSRLRLAETWPKPVKWCSTTKLES